MRHVAALAALLLASPTTADVHAPLENCRALERSDRASSNACYQALMVDPSAAVRAEAAWALGAIEVANRAFHAAARANADDAAIRVRRGELFLAVHQAADAEALFEEALAIDPQHVGALLGQAKNALGRFDRRAETLARRVLEIEPNNPVAHVLLARLALEVGESDRAQASLAGPLEAENVDVRLQAMSLAAAIDHLADRTPSPWEERVGELHASYGEIYETIAYFYVITRRYRQAVVQLERAVALHPQLWSAHATLGLNLLRVNRFDDARRALQLAHGGAPYNAEVSNTLRLLDDDWHLLADEGLILRTDPTQTKALAPYVRRLVAEGVRVFGSRYGFRVPGPVVIELYPRHEDFAVRTSGLPGIGILGATFGDVVVMDSPSARSVDEGFDWASALWHEVAHVITLGATDNRVSRWFSEGVSVLEEWQTGPSHFALDEGQRAVPLAFINAYREARLLPVDALDEGFIRPSYNGQVSVSYVQSGLLCEYIASAYGHQALAAMLVSYRDGADTATAIRHALAIEPATLDAEFADYLHVRLNGIDTAAFQTALAQAHEAATAGNWNAAADAARLAVSSYPHFVDAQSPYPLLAEAESQLGDRSAAIDALTTYWRAGGRTTTPLTRLADWLMEANRAAEALEVQQALALVSPLHADRRARFGDSLLAAGRAEEALAEYAAYVSLQPHDKAGAHYRMARAEHSVGNVGAARRHLLQALEIAPRFAAALAMLLEMGKTNETGLGDPPNRPGDTP